MTSTHSSRRASRCDFVGHRSPVTCSLSASPRAKCSPEAAGKEFAERGDRLSDDHRVVSLARRGHDTERDRRRLHRRAEPRPRVPGMSLALAPRSEMIRAHRRLEARRLQQPPRHHAAATARTARERRGSQRLARQLIPVAAASDASNRTAGRPARPEARTLVRDRRANVRSGCNRVGSRDQCPTARLGRG